MKTDRFNLLLIFNLWFITGCHSASPQAISFTEGNHGIVGGSTVTSADDFYSHIVAVYDERRGALCTGTLIRQDLVLTAAHCVDGSPTADSFKILLGLDLKSSLRPSIQADAIVIHSGYQKDAKESAYDVALIRLAERAPSKYRPARIALETGNFDDSSNHYLTAGYGITEAGGNDAGTLRKLEVQGKNLAVRRKGSVISINARHAGGFCNGDSGGPLFKIIRAEDGETKYSVMGVASEVTQIIWLGFKLNEICKGTGYYTSVPMFAQWIEKNAAEL